MHKIQHPMILFLKYLIVATLFLFSTTSCENKKTNESAIIQLDLITTSLEKPLSENIAILLLNEKRKIWDYFNGYSDTAKQIQLSEKSVVHLAELSSQTTILALLTLVQKGSISLDKSISYYMPEFFSTGKIGGYLNEIAKLPIRTIMSEATGWSLTIKGNNYDIYNDLGRMLDSSPSKYKTGARYTKSSAMIDLLGLLIEKVSGKSFSSYVQNAVFSKLNLHSAKYYPENSNSGNDSSFRNSTVELFTSFSPAYSLSMSFKDTIKLYSLILENTTQKQLIETDVLENMFKPIITNQLNKEGFETGAGWNLTDINLKYLGRVAWNYGVFLDQRSLVILLLDKKLGIIISARNNNRVLMNDLVKVAHEVLQAYADTEFKIKPPSFSAPVAIGTEGLPVLSTGIYASKHGAIIIESQGASIVVSYNGGYAKFVHTGAGIYKPETENEYEDFTKGQGNEILVHWKSGRENSFILQEPIKNSNSLKLKSGIYTSAHPEIAGINISFGIEQIFGNYCITDDEGRMYVLIPQSKSSASILCDDTSILNGLMLIISENGTIQLHQQNQ